MHEISILNKCFRSDRHENMSVWSVLPIGPPMLAAETPAKQEGRLPRKMDVLAGWLAEGSISFLALCPTKTARPALNSTFSMKFSLVRLEQGLAALATHSAPQSAQRIHLHAPSRTSHCLRCRIVPTGIHQPLLDVTR